jgi:hypothetical protein
MSAFIRQYTPCHLHTVIETGKRQEIGATAGGTGFGVRCSVDQPGQASL